jgi:DUF1365 family protein
MTATAQRPATRPAVDLRRLGAQVVDATVTHRRTRPFDYRFSHRTTAWLVDLDRPRAGFPRWLRRVVTVREADHLSPGSATMRWKLEHYLRSQRLPWQAHRVLVLTGARTFGYAFDPLTTYFVLDRDGNLEGILAEVHNTYGERHCYPLTAEAGAGGARTAKEFYVSPFFTVEGRYDIRARLDHRRVSVTISLTQGEHRVFTGTVSGGLEPATGRSVLRAVLRDPVAAQRVTALIRLHGITLWLRRLPVVPRLPHRTPKGLS